MSVNRTTQWLLNFSCSASSHWVLNTMCRCHTFSMACREALFLPLEKNSSLALAQGTRSPAVRAARCSSPTAGSESSSKICCSILLQKYMYISKSIHFNMSCPFSLPKKLMWFLHHLVLNCALWDTLELEGNVGDIKCTKGTNGNYGYTRCRITSLPLHMPTLILDFWCLNL